MYCAARRRFHVQQLLDRLAVAQPVGDRGHVIHAVHVGIEHRVGAVLGNLLHPAMQVADDAFGAQHFFAIQLEDDAQHAVGRGMLRPHVEDQFGGVEEGLVLGIEVEIVHHARATLTGLRVAIIGFEFLHCPLSMPRLICTHSLSCCRMA